MQLPFGTPLVIVNPSAGPRHSTVPDRLVTALRDRGVEPDVVVASSVGDIEVIAEQAAASGRRFVVAVGGDGTVQNVVNGLIDAQTGSARTEGGAPVLGVVGAGSGGDLMRTFGLDRSPEILVDHLLSADVTPLDLIRIRLTGRDGRPTVRLAVNVAEVGYGATVARLAALMPRWWGTARYPAGVLAGAVAFRRPATTLRVDAGERTEEVCNVVVANGQFFGGGLHVSPRSLPADGQLDVQSWGAAPRDLLTAQRQLSAGAHLERPDVRSWRSREVFVDAGRPLAVEADGEVLGTTPAWFEVLTGAVHLKV